MDCKMVDCSTSKAASRAEAATETMYNNAYASDMVEGRTMEGLASDFGSLQAQFDLFKSMMESNKAELEDVKSQVSGFRKGLADVATQVQLVKASQSVANQQNTAGQSEFKVGTQPSDDKDNGPKQDDEKAARGAEKGQSFGPNPQQSNVILHNEDFEDDPPRPSAVPHRLSALDWRKAQARMEGLRYDLKETVWDVLVFVRLDMMYWSDEMLVFLVGILNLAIQWLFILIVSKSMIGGGVDWTKSEVVGDMLDWRVKFAHDPEYADQFTDVSLARAVCEKKTVNMQGIQQANIYLEVDEYLESLNGFASGDILCMLSVLLWSFTCLRELMTCTKFCQGIWLNVYDSGSVAFTGFRRLRSARSSIVIKTPTLVVVEDEVTQKSVVLNISLFRACLVTMFAIIPRVLVLAFLGYVGVLFLIQTIALEDLILNAVALEVVLHVDEMMYDLFAPQLCKRVLSKTYPLRLAKSSIAAGRAMPYMKILGAAFLLGLIRAFWLQPIVQNLEDTKEVMCGGNKNFLFVEIAKGPVTAGTATDKKEVSRSDYNYLAVLQRTGLNVKEADSVRGASPLYMDSDNTAALFPIPNVVAAKKYIPLQIVDLASASLFSPYLVDGCPTNLDMKWERQAVSSQYALRSAIVTITGVPGNLLLPPVNISSACEELKNRSLCISNLTKGKWVRFFCPAACGANDPLSGLAFDTYDEGIPNVCSTREFGNALVGPLMGYPSLPCVDLPTGHPAFQYYASSMAKFVYATILRLESGNITRTDAYIRNSINPIASMGCQYATTVNVYISSGVPYYMHVIMCNPDYFELLFGSRTLIARTLRYLCPVSCGCNSTVKAKIDRDGIEITGKVLRYENCMQSCWA